MSWQTKPLREVADFTSGKALNSAKKNGELLPYLANINVRWGFIDLENLREMYFEAKEIEKYMLEYGDILMCESGEPGRCAIWKKENSHILIQNHVYRIRPNKELNNTFLYYYFLDFGAKKGFDQFANGATIQCMSRQKLASVPISFPNFEEQTRIAAILSAYDDLIANNRRRMQLLETAARRLYRHHFAQASPKPRTGHWAVLGEVAQFINGFAFKSETFCHDGDFGIVTIKNVHDGEFINQCDSRIDVLPEKMPSNCVLKNGDILLSLTGNVGRCCLVFGEGFLLNQRVAKIIPKSNLYREFIYCLLRDEDFKKQMELLSNGVAQQNLSTVKLKELKIYLPSEEELQKFSVLTSDFFEKIIVLNLQNHLLTRTRDLLLPRLMRPRG